MKTCYAVFSAQRFLRAIRHGERYGYLFDALLSDRQLVELVLYYVILNTRNGMTAEDYVKYEYFASEAMVPKLIPYLDWSKDLLALKMRELFRVIDHNEHIEVYDINHYNITLLLG